jgi:hypothetical protein
MPDVHGLLEKLPHPKGGFTLPNMRYCGPFNPLEVQLDENDEPNPGHEPVNSLDSACKTHDVLYRDFPDEKHRWDKQLLRQIDALGPSNGWRESLARKFVKGIIWGKVKLGLGVGEGAGTATGRLGGCLTDSDEDLVLILHAPSLEMGQLLKNLSVQKVSA